MPIRILHNDYPQRSIALVTSTHALVFRHAPPVQSHSSGYSSHNASFVSTATDRTNGSSAGHIPRCIVEFAELRAVDLEDYAPMTNMPCLGTLGLITLAGDVFLCVVTGAREVAGVRPGETVLRIHAIEFHCINRSDFDHLLESEINPHPTEPDGYDQGRSQQPVGLEHPCLSIKKLLSDGTFYYSRDFDLTNRLQDSPASLDTTDFDIDNFDPSFLWNSYMISPLLRFRSRLSETERHTLDSSNLLTSVIRGFVESLTIPRPSAKMEGRLRSGSLPATLTLISRLSCKRAGTRFNSRGIDDDGNVANFVETETVVWDPGSGPDRRAVGFSYCQIRGSIPIFWEQQSGLLPNQQKIQITRSPEATQPAFDKHIEGISLKYGATHVVNLLSETKPGEVELSTAYRHHIRHSPLVSGAHRDEQSGKFDERTLLRSTEYDFHAETKGPGGYEAASLIRHRIEQSADGFAYFLMEQIPEEERLRGAKKEDGDGEIYEPNNAADRTAMVVLQQEGVFRTNCLDCLDRTNLVQGIISKMAIEMFLTHRGEGVGNEFWMRHQTLWADNGDALSKIYAGTGALKSSFTRTGKMSLAGAIADARKSATRMYINNFADKGRQNTIDLLLGRLVGQEPVYLYDPINDYVTSELKKRSASYSSEKQIRIYVGTFNLNGRTSGVEDDLSVWLCPALEKSQQNPELVVIGFQEIVELSPQQIMSTDPAKRQLWEKAVRKCLDRNCKDDEYILLRSGQLVGAALLIFVKASVIAEVKNVEGSIKKTGLSGVAGNKGAVAIRMEYASTRLCFVTAHLAAGFSNAEERNRDYKTIADGLRFQRGRKIDDHDTVIWLGDFNYRIGLPDEKVRKLIEFGDLQTLYDNDQLNLQMVAGFTFPYYSEAKIDFDPTYKFDVGTDRYDTSEKSRIPAWCDRILRKGDNIRQLSYNSAPLRFSDHRPVYATFQCVVSVVNEVMKEKLSREIYSKRREDMGDLVVVSGTEEDEEDLLDFEAIAPGLPPPSSDRSLPAKSTVRPPGSDYVLNPQRPTNPFTEASEPDWVKVKSDHTGASSVSASSSISLPSRQPSKNGPRRLPPPFNPSEIPALPHKTEVPLRKPLPTTTTPNTHSRQPSSGSVRSIIYPPPPPKKSPASKVTPLRPVPSTPRSLPPPLPPGKPQSLKQAPPPIPRKPVVLLSPQPLQSSPIVRSASTNSSSLFNTPASDGGGYNTGGSSSSPPSRYTTPISIPDHNHTINSAFPSPPPPPLSRSATVAMAGSEISPPRLPPRTRTFVEKPGGLMDDDVGGELGGLGGWEPLRPR